jgi:PrcB C-terminal
MNMIQRLTVYILFSSMLDSGAANAPSTLPVRSLARGVFSGVAEARREVIRDPASWEKLWKEHATSEKSAEIIPAVDFANEMVIAVTMGDRRTGGYSVEIERVEPAEKSLKIFVKQTAPRPGTMTIQTLTAPFHFVAVPKSDLKPEFVAINPKATK